MIDFDSRIQARSDDPRTIELRVAANLENLAVLRTLVAAIAMFQDLDTDAVADAKLAVDEACTRLIRSAIPGSTLVIVLRPLDRAMTIDISTDCYPTDVFAPGSFSWYVLNSLTEQVRLIRNNQRTNGKHVLGISMTTKPTSPLT
jgi:hypothetical protein